MNDLANLRDLASRSNDGDLRGAVLEAANEIARLREAGEALRDDMLERSRAGMDVIHGEKYRIVNAGNSAWVNFCEALDQGSGK